MSPESAALPSSAPGSLRWRAVGPARDVGLTLVLLHGFGSNREDMLQLAPFLPFARLLAPHGPLNLGVPPGTSGLSSDDARDPAKPHASITSKAFAWYRFPNLPAGGWDWDRLATLSEEQKEELLRPDPGTFEQSVALVCQLLEQLRQTTPAAGQRWVIGGFSQGAVLSAAVGLRRPDLVNGVILMSGQLPPASPTSPAPSVSSLAGRVEPGSCSATLSETASHPIRAPRPPVWIHHGLYDPLVPFTQARRMASHFERLGYPVAFCAAACGHEIPPPSLVQLERWLTDCFVAG